MSDKPTVLNWLDWFWSLCHYHIYGHMYKVGLKTGLFLEVCNSCTCWHRKTFHISNCSVLQPSLSSYCTARTTSGMVVQQLSKSNCQVRPVAKENIWWWWWWWWWCAIFVLSSQNPVFLQSRRNIVNGKAKSCGSSSVIVQVRQL